MSCWGDEIVFVGPRISIGRQQPGYYCYPEVKNNW
jgi:hypothetical protein